jgi:hypothetical protein
MSTSKKDASKRQVKFECTDDFYERLNREKLRRNLTLQQLAIRALDFYLAVPESTHRQLEERTEWGVLNVRRVDPTLIWAKPKEGEQISIYRISRDPRRVALASMLDFIQTNFEEFPEEKWQLLQKSLELDVKYYRSARIKQPKAEATPTESTEERNDKDNGAPTA